MEGSRVAAKEVRLSTASSTVEPTAPERARCRLCGAETWDTVAALSGYSVLRCRRCSFVFSDLADAEIPGLYDETYFRDEFGPYFSASFGSADKQLVGQFAANIRSL